MGKKNTAAHGWRVQHAVGHDKTNRKKEIGSRQESDGCPADTNKNGRGTGARTEHNSQEAVSHQYERNEEQKGDDVSAV